MSSSSLGKALVVDDEKTNRLILKSLLSKQGYQTIEAVDGAQAVELFKQENPTIVFMDIVMPVMDGYEATRQIKGNPALERIPVIAVTSYALSGDEAKAMAAGCDGYVTKPFRPRDLLAKVREYLS